MFGSFLLEPKAAGLPRLTFSKCRGTAREQNVIMAGGWDGDSAG